MSLRTFYPILCNYIFLFFFFFTWKRGVRVFVKFSTFEQRSFGLGFSPRTRIRRVVNGVVRVKKTHSREQKFGEYFEKSIDSSWKPRSVEASSDRNDEPARWVRTFVVDDSFTDWRLDRWNSRHVTTLLEFRHIPKKMVVVSSSFLFEIVAFNFVPIRWSKWPKMIKTTTDKEISLHFVVFPFFRFSVFP